MSELIERREERGTDLRRIFDKLEAIDSRVSSVDTKLQVHLAKFESTDERVQDHEQRWRDWERWKDKALFRAAMIVLASGVFGGGAAHFAKRFLE